LRATRSDDTQKSRHEATRRAVFELMQRKEDRRFRAKECAMRRIFFDRTEF
jgi:hypothetical protein